MSEINPKIKKVYDDHFKKTGKPLSSSTINKLEEATRKRSHRDLDKHIDYEGVPDVLKPIDKMDQKGVREIRNNRDKKYPSH